MKHRSKFGGALLTFMDASFMDVWDNAVGAHDELEELNRQIEALKKREESLKHAKDGKVKRGVFRGLKRIF